VRFIVQGQVFGVKFFGETPAASWKRRYAVPTIEVLASWSIIRADFAGWRAIALRDNQEI
jgi:hypothetical protein